MNRDKWLAIRNTDRRALRDRVLTWIKGPFRTPGGGTKDPARTHLSRSTPKMMRKRWAREAVDRELEKGPVGNQAFR